MWAKLVDEMSSEEREKLISAIVEEPDDDAPRLVYADWLLERNDPLGELIQVSCKLARVGEEEAALLRQRENELLEAHQLAWLGTAYSPLISWEIERGFATGRFGHKGMWIALDDDRLDIFRVTRFYPKGLLIDVTIGSKPSKETYKQVAGWFHENWERRMHGSYEVAFPLSATAVLPFGEKRPASGAPAMRFSSRNGNEPSVDHTGTIDHTTISTRWHSNINNADGAWTYALEDVEGADTRVKSVSSR